MPVTTPGFNIIAETNFGDTDVVNGPTGRVYGVVGDIFKADQNFQPGVGRQINMLLDPGWSILTRQAGVTRPVSVAGGIIGDAVGGLQNRPGLTIIR